MVISLLFQQLKAAEVQAHYFHLNTTSYARHMALGAFYDAINDLNDDLAEKLIAKGNKLIMPKSLPLDTTSEDQMLDTLALYVDKAINDTNNQLDVQDILVNIKNLINQTKYLFKLS